MKLCVDCAYYRPGVVAECTMSTAESPVDGKVRRQSCIYLRADCTSCGPEGKWFQPRPPVQTVGLAA